MLLDCAKLFTGLLGADLERRSLDEKILQGCDVHFQSRLVCKMSKVFNQSFTKRQKFSRAPRALAFSSILL